MASNNSDLWDFIFDSPRIDLFERARRSGTDVAHCLFYVGSRVLVLIAQDWLPHAGRSRRSTPAINRNEIRTLP
jgi:hypothetical protein